MTKWGVGLKSPIFGRNSLWRQLTRFFGEIRKQKIYTYSLFTFCNLSTQWSSCHEYYTKFDTKKCPIFSFSEKKYVIVLLSISDAKKILFFSCAHCCFCSCFFFLPQCCVLQLVCGFRTVQPTKTYAQYAEQDLTKKSGSRTTTAWRVQDQYILKSYLRRAKFKNNIF